MCKECGCGENGTMVTKVFTVPGMMCGNCQETVEGATIGLDGVVSSHVDLPEKTVTITYDSTKNNVETISKAILATGFEVAGVANHVHHHTGFLGTIKKLFK